RAGGCLGDLFHRVLQNAPPIRQIDPEAGQPRQQAVEMGLDVPRPAVVHPQGFEEALAEEETDVVGREADLPGRHGLPVPPGEAQAPSPTPRAVRKARALAVLSASSSSGSESATMPQPA